MTAATADRAPTSDIESPYAWLRLGVAVAMAAVGGVGLWSLVVALPAIQADFGVDRAAASLPYAFAMMGFAGGGVVIGRLADRFGILAPLALGTVSLGIGYISVGLAPNLWMVTAAHVLLGFGCSATFAPLIADISHWFSRRRGIAVGIVASGN